MYLKDLNMRYRNNITKLKNTLIFENYYFGQKSRTTSRAKIKFKTENLLSEFEWQKYFKTN